MLALLCASTLAFVVYINGDPGTEYTNWADVPNTNKVGSLTIKSGDFSTRSMLNDETNIFQELVNLTITKDVNLDENMSICEKWFSDHKNLKSVIINTMVKSVGAYAFNNCRELVSVIFNSCDGCVVNSGAFYSCENLATLFLENVTTIEDSAFTECISLGVLHFLQLTTIGNQAFMYCYRLTEFRAPSLQEIFHESFSYCGSLECISVDSLTYIGDMTFAGCFSLTNIYFPSLEVTGEMAFAFCESLASVDLPKLSAPGKECFCGCSLEYLELPSLTEPGNFTLADSSIQTVVFSNLSYVNSDCFREFATLERVEIPNVTWIAERGFYNCMRLCDFVAPNLEVIGKMGLANCSSIRSLSLLRLKEIEQWGIEFCTQLTTVILPSLQVTNQGSFLGCSSLEAFHAPSLENIADECFANATKLSYISCLRATTLGKKSFEKCFALGTTTDESMVYLNSVATIGEKCFTECRGLVTINLPNAEVLGVSCFEMCSSLKECKAQKATTIENNAFFQDISLESATFDLCTTVGNNVFDSCSSLHHVSFASLALDVGDYVFRNCTSLSDDIHLGNLVRTGKGMFMFCYELQDKVFDNMPKLEQTTRYAFVNCTSLRTVRAPAIYSLDSMSFSYCSGLESVYMPKLRSIHGDRVFDGCTNLTIVNFPMLFTVEDDAYMLFNQCESLERLYLPEKVPETFREDMFENTTKKKLILCLPTYDAYRNYEGQPWDDIDYPSSHSAWNSLCPLVEHTQTSPGDDLTIWIWCVSIGCVVIFGIIIALILFYKQRKRIQKVNSECGSYARVDM